MKKIILLLLLYGMVLPCLCQSTDIATANTQVDGLKNELRLVNSDSLKSRLMVEIAEAFVYTNLDSSEHYATKALAIAEESNFVQEQLGALGFLGLGLINRGNLPNALELGMEAMEIGEQASNVTAGIGPNYDNLGQVYALIGDYDKAIEYYSKEVALGEQDLMGPAYGYLGIANLLIKKTLLDSALHYLDKSYEAFGRINYSYYPDIYHVYPHWYNTRAKIYIHQSKKKLALLDFHQSLNMTLSYKEVVLSAETCNDIARFYEAENQVDSCIHYADLAVQFAQGINFTKGVLEAAKILAKQYETINPVKALYYFKLAEENQNKLYGAGNLQAIRDMILQDEKRKQEMFANELAFNNRLRQYLLIGGLLLLLLISFVLFSNNRKTLKNNKLLNQQKTQIENALHQLKSTQAQLIQSEKMASLGELTAGIAHEIQNPLNFVNNFSDINKELLEELKEEADKGDLEEVKAIANDVISNEEKINHHGKRADTIVKGMLQHSRTSSGEKVPTDINELADEYLRLAYHGLRAKDHAFNAAFEMDFDANLPKVNVIPQEIGRVLLNLINNAFQAVDEKNKSGIDGYAPKVNVSTKLKSDMVEIVVEDNGLGIQEDIKDKIFQPFFTTKPTGQGTGLGLSLSYDIVKAHGGTLEIQSDEGLGSTFIISLPQKFENE